jgi:hypothetical protein
MLRAVAIVATLVASAAVVASAGAADPPKALRHLVYSVSAGASTITEVKRSGFGQNGGNSEDFGVAGILNKGTIALDVLSVTSDGALVIDVTEDAQARTTPRTRVAVFDDGRVLFDPKNTLMPESLELLRLCARHVFDEHIAVAGSKWTEDHAQQSGNETTTYETSEVVGDRSFVRFERSISGKGIASSVEMRAAIVYDRHFLMPIAGSLGQRIRTNDIEQAKRTTVNWQIRLLEDSFSKTTANSDIRPAILPPH